MLGRVLVGPVLSLHGMLELEVRRCRRGERDVRGIWLIHLTLCAGLLLAINWLSGMPLAVYGLGVAWPALALALIRSFYEHRPALDPA